MWRRGLAFLIDLILFLILTTIENLIGIADNAYVGLLNLLLLIIYFACMNYWLGGTLGKRIVGLRVALRSSPDIFYRLIVRALIKIIFMPMGTIYGLIAIWRKDGRSIADFASGTTVIEVSSHAPPKQASIIGRISASILLVFAPWLFMTIMMIVCFSWMIVENWEKLYPFLNLFLGQ